MPIRRGLNGSHFNCGGFVGFGLKVVVVVVVVVVVDVVEVCVGLFEVEDVVEFFVVTSTSPPPPPPSPQTEEEVTVAGQLAEGV